MTWRTVTLNELQAPEPRAITDGPFGSNLARQHYTDAGPRVVRLQNIGDGVFVDAKAHISEQHFKSLAAHEVCPGDLLIASLGEVLPRACIAPVWLGPAIVKADCIRVRLSAGVDTKWVMYAMQRPAVRRWADKHRHGVGRPRLGLKVIREIPVPLPELSEQQRIVGILEDHLSRLDAADGGLADAQRRVGILRDRLVGDAITGATTPGPRHKAVLTEAGSRDGDLPSLPSGWEWRRLGDIADVVGGVTKDANKQSDPDYVEVPYLRVANVQRGALRLDKVTLIHVPQSKAKALALEPGDVLLNEGGDRDKLARGWVWEGQIDGCIHQNHVFRARVRGELDPYFLSWTANTIGGRWAERNGKQSVNLASISLSMIRKMPVIVPAGSQSGTIVEGLHSQLASLDRVPGSWIRHGSVARGFGGRCWRRRLRGS